MKINAYYNGTFSTFENVKIPLTDRAVFFGDGIYDAAIGRNGKIFMLDDHIDRFIGNAREMDIPLPVTTAELKEILIYLAGQSADECYFVYFQLTRYSESRCHAYPLTEKSNLLVTVTKQKMPDVEKPISVTLARDIRHELCHVKTLNLLPAVLASRKAENLRRDEVILHRNGIVTECAHSNVHIIQDSVLITHPLDNHILPGISRKHLISVCKRMGIAVREREFSVYELFKADEVVISSSSKLAIPVCSVDYLKFPRDKNSLGSKICAEMLSDFIKFTKNDTRNC